MHMDPQIGDDNRLAATIGYMPHTKLQRDARPVPADKHDRLASERPYVRGLAGCHRVTEAPAPCPCESTERDQDAVFPALMLLQAWKSRRCCKGF